MVNVIVLSIKRKTWSKIKVFFSVNDEGVFLERQMQCTCVQIHTIYNKYKE